MRPGNEEQMNDAMLAMQKDDTHTLTIILQFDARQ